MEVKHKRLQEAVLRTFFFFFGLRLLEITDLVTDFPLVWPHRVIITLGWHKAPWKITVADIKRNDYAVW